MRWAQTVDIRPHESLYGRLQSARYATARVQHGDLWKPIDFVVGQNFSISRSTFVIEVRRSVGKVLLSESKPDRGDQLFYLARTHRTSREFTDSESVGPIVVSLGEQPGGLVEHNALGRQFRARRVVVYARQE